jgi:hypothetical protein
MRRSRHKLEVSTFPFLAVLLCAMGSLILLLLVLDRRAKAAARERAYKAAEQVAAKELDIAEERKQEWEKRRDAVHAELVAQERDLSGKITEAEKQIAVAQAEQTTEEERRRREKERLRHEEEQIGRLEEVVRTRRTQLSGGDDKVQESGRELQRLSQELRSLERTLEELKALRERQQKTYSVVPYRGKHGDNRAPLYLECAASGLIFHPDRKTISMPGVAGEAIKAEVRGRVVRQRVGLKAAGRAPDDKPYLLMLIRPDGITAYYQTVHALNGLDVDFGYELIDADWVLEFPADGELSKAQPWMTAEKEAVKPSDPSRVPGPPPVGINRTAREGIWANAPGKGDGTRGTGGGAIGAGDSHSVGPGGISGLRAGAATGLNPVMTGAAGSAGSGTRTGGPGGTSGASSGSGLAPAMTGAAGSAGSGMQSGSGGGSPSGTTAGKAGLPGDDARPAVGAQGRGGQIGMGAPGIGDQAGGPDIGSISGSLPGFSDPNRGAGAQPGAPGGSSNNPGGGMPPAPPLIAAGPTIPSTGTGVHSAAGTPGDGSVLGGNGGNPGAGPAVNSGPSPAVAGTPTENGSTDVAGSGGAKAGSSSAVGEPRSPTPIPSSGRVHVINGNDNGTSQDDAADNQSTPPNEGGRRAPLQGVDNEFLRSKKPAKRQELRPALLGGDRDYIIMLECRANSVVLYPYGNSFSTESLAAKNGGGVVLVEAIKRMIARKQTSVRTGEQPYRPQVRFMVRPDGLQSMHKAYPLLEELHVPLTRQNLDADDDVRLGD